MTWAQVAHLPDHVQTRDDGVQMSPQRIISWGVSYERFQVALAESGWTPQGIADEVGVDPRPLSDGSRSTDSHTGATHTRPLDADSLYLLPEPFQRPI